MGETSRVDAGRLDAEDVLGDFRGRFHLPDGLIYLDGNSLGPLPRDTVARLGEVVEREWANDLIGSWNVNRWMEMPERVGARIAALIGARPDEVVATDSTSVNLFKLLAGAVRQGLDLGQGRCVILAEQDAFPTDLYIAEGVRRFLGDPVELVRVPGDRIVSAIDERVAVVLVGHVDYRTGRVQPMREICAAARERGALTLWDLSHSAGALPVALNECAADLAVGCGYKYLNGGPGAPAYLYVARRLHEALEGPLSGWMGHADPFEFEGSYRPAAGIRRYLCGTPSVLAMAALECGVELLSQAPAVAVREKSMRLTDLFVDRVLHACARFGVELASPRDAEQRGSQVSFRHCHGYAVVQAMIDRGVVGDFRTPDVMRFGFAPLYVRYVDAWDAAEAMHAVLAEAAWDDERFRRRSTVT